PENVPSHAQFRTKQRRCPRLRPKHPNPPWHRPLTITEPAPSTTAPKLRHKLQNSARFGPHNRRTCRVLLCISQIARSKTTECWNEKSTSHTRSKSQAASVCRH